MACYLRVSATRMLPFSPRAMQDNRNLPHRDSGRANSIRAQATSIVTVIIPARTATAQVAKNDHAQPIGSQAQKNCVFPASLPAHLTLPRVRPWPAAISRRSTICSSALSAAALSSLSNPGASAAVWHGGRAPHLDLQLHIPTCITSVTVGGLTADGRGARHAKTFSVPGNLSHNLSRQFRDQLKKSALFAAVAPRLLRKDWRCIPTRGSGEQPFKISP